MRYYIRNHLHSILFRIFTICTIFVLNCSVSFASSTVGQLNQSVSFDFLSIASFKASSNAYFSNTTADPTYLTTASLLGSFINTFGPRYSYQISSFVQGTPATYVESKDVNVHLRDISTNQWYINDNIMRIRDYMDPISAVISDIKTNTTNTAAATNAALQLMGDQVNIDWIDRGNGHLYDLQHNEITNRTTISNPQNYIFQFPAFATQDLSIVRLTLPINPGGRLGNDYTFEFYDYNGSNFIKFSDPKYIYVSNVNGYSVDVYVTNIFLNYNNLCVKVIPSKGSYGFYPDINSIKIYSLNGTSEDFIKVSQFIHLHSIDNKLNDLSTDDVVQALQDLEVNVEVNDSINVTPIDLDVSIGIEDFTAVNTISNKLRTWLTTGVSVPALIGALDTLDDSFFTLSNRNIIETINNQYTDFYD